MIEAENLTKIFGRQKAVDNISFRVNRGEVLGFLGPNGAGKSTTMRMLTGFIPPSMGTVKIGGLSMADNPVGARSLVGYLPENAPVYPDMTVEGFLNFCAEARGHTKSLKKLMVNKAIDKCFLSTVVHQSINTLSKGFKQRVCFAQSILHDPPYLVLDEPTDGLDPNQKHEVREMIRQMSSQKAILLSTHILEEAEAVCDRAIIINKGELIADDTPEGLRRRSKSYGAVTMVFKNRFSSELQRRFEALDGVKEVEIISQTTSETTVRLIPEEHKAPALAANILSQVEGESDLLSFFIDRGRLEEVFRSLTTG